MLDLILSCDDISFSCDGVTVGCDDIPFGCDLCRNVGCDVCHVVLIVEVRRPLENRPATLESLSNLVNSLMLINMQIYEFNKGLRKDANVRKNRLEREIMSANH